MKKLLFGFILMSMVSCSREGGLISRMKGEFKEYELPNFNDPKSFEEVEAKIVDTLYYKDYMGKLVNSYDKSSFYGGLMNSMKMSMDINRRYGLDNSYTQKSYNEYKASYDKEVSARDSIMSIVNKAPADSIYSITLSYKIRVKNNTNALVLKELACVYYPNGAEQYIKPKRYFVFFGLLGDVRN